MQILEKFKAFLRPGAPEAAPAPEIQAPPAAVSGRSQRRLEVRPPVAALDKAIARNNYLVRYSEQKDSQAGEEGVIDEILHRLDIKQGWCVEFGAFDGKTHSNTWRLIVERGWSSVQIEPFKAAFDTLQENYAGYPNVHCFHSFVTPDGDTSLDALLARTPIPTEFELLVIDIDGDDYHVWQAFQAYAPKVVMVEFNPFIAPDLHFVKPLQQRTTAAASLAALYSLARTKGYELTCVVGGNAIFTRRELFERFDIADNRPQAMFQSWGDTKIFQGYDGTLLLAGFTKFVWRYQMDRSGHVDHIDFCDEDIQVLPRGLRVFRPRLDTVTPLLDAQAGRLDRERVASNALLAFRCNHTSECGEDGIIEELLRRLGIGKGYLVDVGAHDGMAFSNTRRLLEAGEWSGLVIEKDEAAFARLASLYPAGSPVVALRAEVASGGDSGLEALLQRHDVPKRFELLCIDIEGNDFHVWRSLVSFMPAVIVIDFNPTVPNDVVFAQEDDPSVNHGASLRALVELAADKGYELAAVTDWNAIFVRRDLFSACGVQDNAIDRMYYPVFESRVIQSMDSFLTLTGCDRLIRHNYRIDQERLQPLAPDLREIADAGSFGLQPSVFFGERRSRPAEGDGTKSA